VVESGKAGKFKKEPTVQVCDATMLPPVQVFGSKKLFLNQ
jgi:hypothetical protein